MLDLFEFIWVLYTHISLYISIFVIFLLVFKYIFIYIVTYFKYFWIDLLLEYLYFYIIRYGIYALLRYICINEYNVCILYRISTRIPHLEAWRLASPETAGPVNTPICGEEPVTSLIYIISDKISYGVRCKTRRTFELIINYRHYINIL